jgi:hypothetical protein
MHSLSFIEQTQQVWAPYYQEPLTRQDSIDIASNVNALFELFSDWAIQLKAGKR